MSALSRIMLGLLLAAAVPGAAAPLRTPHLDVELVADTRAVEPGRAFTVGLRLQHEPHWHTYWKNPGDSGMATAIRWILPRGFRAGALRWPTPARLPIPPLVNFGYEGEVLLLAEIQTPEGLSRGSRFAVSADVDWLVCRETCLPGTARFTLSLPVAAGTAVPDRHWAALISQARADLPRPLAGWTAHVSQRDGFVEIALQPSSGTPASIERLTFFPDEDGIIENAAEQRLSRSGDGYVLRVAAAPGIETWKSVTGLLVAEPGWAQRVPAAAEVDLAMPPPSAASTSGAVLSLVGALALAYAGGLILNLMPCVFPLVSIKVLGFARQAHGERRRMRWHGLSFASGVLMCFWVLAAMLIVLRSGGTERGWGYQLQSPLLVESLAVLFFVLALSLSGALEIGAGLPRAGGARLREGYGGSFLAGLLATLVSTPCTAPFMGTALGYALAQPPAAALLVFTALALGMASPYVLLSFVPALLSWLPRPGRWMETLKQALAFPLYLTVVWLTWVLGEQAGLTAAVRLLSGLVLISAAVWAWGRFGRPGRSASARVASALTALVLAVAGTALAVPDLAPGSLPSPAHGEWEPYSEAGLARARADGRWAFVDFTAAWCVTCQVNKRLVLNADPVARRFAQQDIVLLRADWTRRDAPIGEALRRLGRSGVPVYALYPPDGGPPRLLPEILTRKAVLTALDAARAI